MSSKENILVHKRSAVAGAVPVESDLLLGEVAINTRDGKVFTKKSDGVVEDVVSVITNEIGGTTTMFSKIWVGTKQELLDLPVREAGVLYAVKEEI